MKLKLSFSIIFLALACFFNTYASERTITTNAFNKAADSTKLTINLGNIDLLSSIQIKDLIQKYTNNFLANSSSSKCSIIIKASVSAKEVKQVELSNVSFEVKINGTIAEIKKELETIDVAILDLKKSYREFTF